MTSSKVIHLDRYRKNAAEEANEHLLSNLPGVPFADWSRRGGEPLPEWMKLGGGNEDA